LLKLLFFEKRENFWFSLSTTERKVALSFVIWGQALFWVLLGFTAMIKSFIIYYQVYQF